ncbi:hypothetical protein E3O11_16895 [Cryobacterium levicorallinum]|uniref:Addiction module protein n=2 Tax=Microbacteriaceae TaxID=85023 RepID=A0A4R8VGD4_9MICO|nr:hypothetical protein E3O11_16895 [Cryobacterium levicorallinum]TFD61174.1 hypothetical protein E3T41_08305 [Cryobacterium sp. Hh38]GEP28332.1 hypothetical protein CLE01_29300 [Cryobacterium levicorallinum]
MGCRDQRETCVIHLGASHPASAGLRWLRRDHKLEQAQRTFLDASVASYTGPMALKADEVYEAGLDLSRAERAVVAHRLLASLHPEQGADQREVDQVWQAEIGSRVDDILNGNVELGNFEETRATARALLDDLRK